LAHVESDKEWRDTYFTMTVPFIPMLTWYVQLYGNVPAVLKVVVAEPPPGILPVSQTPVSLVEVWAYTSRFFHVTVVPTATVIVAGEKAIPCIWTVLAGGGLGLGPVGVDP